LAGLILGTANPAFQEKGLRYVLDQSSAVALFLVEDFCGNPIAYIGHEAMRP
jgi:fatty-acyl-CoA synthase